MLNLVLFSDLQYDSYLSFDRSVDQDSGLPRRLAVCRKAIREVADYAKKVQADYAICLGDLLDKKNSTHPSVLYHLKEDLDYLASCTSKVILLSGNHDFLDKSSTRSLLRVYEGSNIKVVERDHVERTSDLVELVFISDTEGKLDLYNQHRTSLSQSELRILCSHVGLYGAQISNDLVSESTVKLSDLHPDSYQYIFLGDYHKHQELLKGKAFYCGALLQKNFSFEGDLQHFAHLQIGRDASGKLQSQLQWIPLSEEFPRFLTVSSPSEVPLDFKGYLRYRSSTPMTIEEISSLRTSLDTSRCSIVSLDAPVKTESSPRIQFQPESGFLERCLQYIREKCPKDLDASSLESRLKSIAS